MIQDTAAVQDGMTCSQCPRELVNGIHFTCTIDSDYHLCARCEVGVSQQCPMMSRMSPSVVSPEPMDVDEPSENLESRSSCGGDPDGLQRRLGRRGRVNGDQLHRH